MAGWPCPGSGSVMVRGMRYVALVRAPGAPEEAARAFALASGLTLAEARMRLAPEPPAVLARVEADKAEALVGTLRKVGAPSVALDASCPTDRDRLLVHRFSLTAVEATFTSRPGDSFRFAWPEVMAILRGLRASRTEVERTEKSRSFSVGRAVMTGGLLLSRTSTKTVRSSSEETEQVLLVYLRDGRAASLAENELEFSSLGKGMQPSSTGNMGEVARRLRENAKTAFYDERLLRLGRRPLPFLLGNDSRTETRAAVTTRSDTSESLDVLAEAMRQALAEGLLP